MQAQSEGERGRPLLHFCPSEIEIRKCSDYRRVPLLQRRFRQATLISDDRLQNRLADAYSA